jgi:hypothetical protein
LLARNYSQTTKWHAIAVMLAADSRRLSSTWLPLNAPHSGWRIAVHGLRGCGPSVGRCRLKWEWTYISLARNPRLLTKKVPSISSRALDRTVYSDNKRSSIKLRILPKMESRGDPWRATDQARVDPIKYSCTRAFGRINGHHSDAAAVTTHRLFSSGHFRDNARSGCN